MLPLLGLGTIVVLLAAILSKRMSPLVALIIVPIAASLIGGFGLHTSKFVIDGWQFRARRRDVRVRDPLFRDDHRRRHARPDHRPHPARGRHAPTRIVMGTTLLALLIHLDGSGAVCFS